MSNPTAPRRAQRAARRTLRADGGVASAVVRFALFTPVIALVALLALLVAAAGTARAHNSLVSSDPADGTTLDVAPTRITWVFDQPVPLETMTVTLIAADGSRTQVEGSVHGPAGEAEVITPLPPLAAGEVTLRWRLVGPDGHVVTGRVGLTVITGSTEAGSPTSLATPATGVATEPPPEDGAVTDAAGSSSSDDASGDTSWSTPSGVRWLLRYASYAAIATALGLVAVATFVWPATAEHARLRRVLAAAAASTAVLGAAQLTVLASDVSGAAPWASLGSIGAATTTDAGMALALRVALAAGLWVVVAGYRGVDRVAYRTALSLVAIALLATWAFAGHARSMRWPAVGVVTDVAHHAAAATWLAGLFVVGVVVAPLAQDAVPTLRRFSTVAATCVAVLVVTGVVQGVRLIGGVTQLFDATHGRLLALKLVAMALMLALAARNRSAVGRELAGGASEPGTVGAARASSEATVAAIRRAMVVELVIGLVVLGITAALVVSPPSTATAPVEPAARFAASAQPLLYIL